MPVARGGGDRGKAKLMVGCEEDGGQVVVVERRGYGRRVRR